jgi:prepilin-type processing-associated H-X9-DG protein
MKRFRGPIRLVQAALALSGLTFAAQSAGEAQTRYQIQPIVRLGDHAGAVVIDDHLDAGALNNSGQIIFLAGNADGDDELVQYADGKLTPIVVPGAGALVIMSERNAEGRDLEENDTTPNDRDEYDVWRGAPQLAEWIAHKRHADGADYLYLDGHTKFGRFERVLPDLFPDHVVLLQPRIF